MDKGISFYFGFDVEPELRAEMIKDAGFDCVITNADKKFVWQNGTIESQVKIFKKVGLKLSSLHMSYNAEDLHYFWENCKKGEKLKKNLIKDVKIAKKYGFTCVVVHLFGEYSEIGKQRLEEVLVLCEKLNVPLAIENINDQKLFLRVFENIKSDMLKFCYDSGHNNVFDRNFDYLENFKDKLITLHLHDNNGNCDEHTLTKYSGSIDWNKIAKSLAKQKNIKLDYEVFGKNDENVSAEEYLKQTFIQAKNLEKLIEKFKK